MDQKLQRHCAVSLQQHGFLVNTYNYAPIIGR